MTDDLTSPIGLGTLFGNEDGGEVQKIVVTSYSDAASGSKEKEKEKTQEEKYQDEVKKYGRQPSGFIGLENQYRFIFD
jgi:hypothetical protein